MRVLHYCQHVLGMGHLFRSLEIDRALGAEGHEVLLVTGGPEVALELPATVRREQLPGLRMDRDFSALLPLEGEQRPLEQIKDARRRRLLALFEEYRPDVFLVELYPFGRRGFAFELVPALELARQQSCRRVCSLRDILVEKKDQQKFERRVLRLLNPDFDLLLVHSDPDLISLERTFSRLEDVRPAVAYTGFVAPSMPQPRQRGLALRREQGIPEHAPLIVASAGSGSVGGELLRAALEAWPHTRSDAGARLQVFSGPLLDEATFRTLRQLAEDLPGVALERCSDRFNDWLAAADLSLCMGGYNTVMALAAVRTFGLVLPFAQNREQRMRAELLQQRGMLRVLEESELQPHALAALLEEHLGRRPPEGLRVDLKGAAKSAKCLQRLQAPPQRRGSVGRQVSQPWQPAAGARQSECEKKCRELGESFLDRLQARCKGARAEIFFRADDVAVPGAQLERLLQLFLRSETSLWAAVVPAWLHESRWRRLLELSRGSELFLWHQHGWRHANHEVCGKKCEFGPGRAVANKRRDLQKGRDKLAAIMGRRFTPIFTPPWNRMDVDALALLPELGFAGLSADSRLCRTAAEALPQPPQLHAVQLDLHTRREESAQDAVENMLAQCDAGLEAGRLGVMLHHQRMNDAAFVFLEAFLRRLPALGLQPALPPSS